MGLTPGMPAEFPFSDIFITKYKSYLDTGEAIRVIMDKETGLEYIVIDNGRNLSVTLRAGVDGF